LRENGFTAYNLNGGIAAWKQAGKPVETAAIVKQMNLQEYQALIPANKTVLVDIGAAWCPPCKKMNPIIDSLATSRQIQFELLKIDGGEQTDICKQLKVEAFPTFIIYKGRKESWRRSGVVAAEELAQALK
jgi:thioredoxin-like negative regulator of GroEL